MDFTYDNTNSKTYLIYKIEQKIDNVCLGMVTNNEIQGLLPVVYTQMNDEKLLKYNITSTIPLQDVMQRVMKKKQVFNLISSIINTIQNVSDYMIDVDKLVLDMKYVYVNISTYTVKLICIPVTQYHSDEDIFFRSIFNSIQIDCNEDVSYLTRITNYFHSTDKISLAEFKQIIDEEVKKQVQSQQQINRPMPINNMPMQTNVPVQNIPIQRNPIYNNPIQNNIPVQNIPMQKAPVQNVPVQNITPINTNVRNKPKKIIPESNNKIDTVAEKSNKPKISLFYLLQHYNRENVELYKQQKEEKEKKKNQKNNKKSGTKHSSNIQHTIPVPTNIQHTEVPSDIQQINPNINNIKAQGVVQPTIQNAPSVMSNIQPQFIAQVQQIDGETTVLVNEDIGETTLLNQSNKVVPYLVREKNKEKIMIDKPIFRIGKEKSYVDYFVSDNTAVSRSHANIITRDGSFFIIDTNSKNHTYVNGVITNSSEEKQISNNDEIMLANEKFTFRMF